MLRCRSPALGIAQPRRSLSAPGEPPPPLTRHLDVVLTFQQLEEPGQAQTDLTLHPKQLPPAASPRAEAEVPLHAAPLSARGWEAGGARQSEQAGRPRSPGCRGVGDEALAAPARLFQEPPASKFPFLPLHQQPCRAQAEPRRCGALLSLGPAG